MTLRHAFTILLLLAPSIGCRREETPALPLPTTTTTSATVPSIESLPASTLTIDGEKYALPPSRLKLNRADGTAVATLATDPAAIVGDNAANTVTLTLRLDIETTADLPASASKLVSQPRDAESDSLDGIYLKGGAVQLTPLDAGITFGGDEHVVTARIVGTFTRAAAGEKDRVVDVVATLAAVVEVDQTEGK